MPRSVIAVALLLAACGSPAPEEMPDAQARVDLHSFANADQIRTRDIALDLTVDFERKALDGTATLEIERLADADQILLDTRDLTVHSVETSPDGETFTASEHELAPPDQFLGSKLTAALPADARFVRVRYTTAPGATGLQWLEPSMTAGGEQPFLFSQAQAVHARSFVPCQDTPGVRSTYSAVLRVPEGLTAVMSAAPGESDEPGVFRFRMPQAIPSYLIALAVGDLQFQEISPRAGVYAEPSVVAEAAAEFSDIEAMMAAAEKLYGPYRWERYDILVLPPSFPYGGMENPRLTFATPTLLAGDKSLVNVIAHELAHSWSGNLVTNATWRDFWLNEGFTVYLETRIQEEVYSPARSRMELALEVQDLKAEMADMEPRNQILHIDLAGRDPDDGFSQVPYIKGALLLETIEREVGREKFDAFLRGYFDHFAFQSITTGDFRAYLAEHLPEAPEKVDLDAWIEQPGLLDTAATPESDALAQVDAARERWESGEVAASSLETSDWATQQWLHFISGLGDDVGPDRMAKLDAAFGFTESGNAEIAARWLEESIDRGYEPAYPRLEQFLTSVGRRKFLKPLYEALAKTPEGLERGRSIYEKARAGYHPIAQITVDQILDVKGD